MNGLRQSHEVLRAPSCPRWFRTNSETTKDTKVHKGRRLLLRWLKFNVVGGIGVQLAALSVLRSLLRIDYLIATALAVETAVLHNFVWHERFTWADRPSDRPMQSLARLLEFNLTNGALSIVGNLALMRLLVGQFRINYFVANLGAIALCSLANFFLGEHLVFRSRATST